MSAFKTVVETQHAHIMTLRVILLVCVIVLAMLWYGWKSAPNDISVHIPPTFKDGAVLPIHSIPEPNVYTFANHIFQQLQRWQTDGLQDYKDNIYNLQYFLTPRYQDALSEDYKNKHTRGELINTQRHGQVIAGHVFEDGRVETLSQSAWVVYLDFEITEYVGGLRTKRVEIRYPIRVVRYDIDREKNQWGLALDGYPDGLLPKRLKDIQAAELAQQTVKASQ